MADPRDFVGKGSAGGCRQWVRRVRRVTGDVGFWGRGGVSRGGRMLLTCSKLLCGAVFAVCVRVSRVGCGVWRMGVCGRGQIFGTPSELVEMFDTAHVLMFLIVVLFVTMTGLILWRFSTFCEDWEGYELTAIEAVKQVRLFLLVGSLLVGRGGRLQPWLVDLGLSARATHLSRAVGL
jgi:hypothetical protein